MTCKYLIIVVVLANLSFTNFNLPDFEGIILKATGNQILLATELSLSEFEQIRELPVAQIQNADVLGEAYYGLISLTYEEAEYFSPGDQVEVWIEGEILKAYPLMATAKKVSLLKKAC